MIEHNIRARQELARRQRIKQRLLSTALARGFEFLKGMGLKDLSPEQAIVSTKQPSDLITDEDRTKQLVLRSSALEVLRTPVEQLGTAETNATRLRDAIRVVTEPYYWLFVDKVPTPKKKWFGGDQATTHSWSEVEYTDDLKVNYGYTIGFTPNNGKSTLNSTWVVLASHHDPEGSHGYPTTSPVLALSYENGEVNRIRLTWRQEKPEALLKLTENTAFGKLLNEVFVFKNRDYNEEQGIDISLAGNPKIEFTEHFKGFMTWTSDQKPVDPKLYSWFEYRPGANIFNRYFHSKDEYKRWGKSTREHMDVREFIEVLKGTLDLIPTIDLNKIK